MLDTAGSGRRAAQVEGGGPRAGGHPGDSCGVGESSASSLPRSCCPLPPWAPPRLPEPRDPKERSAGLSNAGRRRAARLVRAWGASARCAPFSAGAPERGCLGGIRPAIERIARTRFAHRGPLNRAPAPQRSRVCVAFGCLGCCRRTRMGLASSSMSPLGRRQRRASRPTNDLATDSAAPVLEDEPGGGPDDRTSSAATSNRLGVNRYLLTDALGLEGLRHGRRQRCPTSGWPP